MMRALVITSLAGVALGIVLLLLGGCETMEVTGRVYVEDPESGSKGGLVIEPGVRPGWWVRIGGAGGTAEISGRAPVVAPEK